MFTLVSHCAGYAYTCRTQVYCREKHAFLKTPFIHVIGLMRQVSSSRSFSQRKKSLFRLSAPHFLFTWIISGSELGLCCENRHRRCLNNRTDPGCGGKFYFVVKIVFILVKSYHCSARYYICFFSSMNPFDGTRKLCFSLEAELYAILLTRGIKS